MTQPDSPRGEVKDTFAIIEHVVSLRDRLSLSRADLDTLADVANELSRLNDKAAELDYAYRVIDFGFEYGAFDFSVLRQRARAAALQATERSDG